jgi:predicted nucleotidyltransferase component of viral defense system
VKIGLGGIDELLGTKLRALYQRKKGRDLFDLWYAAKALEVSPESVVSCFLRYLEHEGHQVSRAEFELNLFEKLNDRRFLDDMAPLLTTGTTIKSLCGSVAKRSRRINLC